MKTLKLLAVLLLISVCGFSQTHTFCPLDGTCVWTKPQTFKNWNGNCDLSQYSGNDGGIAAAQADGCVSAFIPQSAGITQTTGATITTPHFSIWGPGTFKINHTSDAITVSAQYVNISPATVQIITTSDRSTSSVIVQNSTLTTISGITLVGNGTSVNNGRFFTATGNGPSGTSGGVFMHDIFMQEGFKWQDFLYMTNGNNSGTSATFLIDHITGGATFKHRGIYINGFFDTVQFSGGGIDGALDGGTADGQTIDVNNDIANSAGGPRWIHFNDFTCENGSTSSGHECIRVDATRDFQYHGYVANSQQGIIVGTSASATQETDINHTVFAGIGRQCISLGTNALYTQIDGNKFDDCADSLDNTYPIIAAAANTVAFTVSGNTARNVSSAVSKPTYFFDGGASIGHYAIYGNRTSLASWGTGILNGTCSSTNSFVMGNGNAPECSKNTASGFTLSGAINASLYQTATNCASAGGTCVAAPAGRVSIAAAATTVTVATTAATANSEIVIQEDSTLGTALSVTCNTTLGRSYAVTTRTAGTSFVITSSAAPVTNPACLSYRIIN